MVVEKIKPDSMSFDELMQEIRNGTIKIPDFQRDFVWERSQIIDLLDSIYQHYPIGLFIFWQSSDNICAYKNIGGIELKPAPEGKEINYVLDGQQRITSLFASLEEAEIKIKLNGRLKKKKLQIFFDLDKNEFTTSTENNEDEDLETKKKYIWLFPRKGNYEENLISILTVIDGEKQNKKTLEDWFIQKFQIVPYSAMNYVYLLQSIGFVEETDGFFTLSYLAKEYLQTRNVEFLMRLLIKNTEFFSEIIESLLDKKEVREEDLLEYFNENYDADSKSTSQIRHRLDWLWKLGFCKYKDGCFILKNESSEFLQHLIEINRLETTKIKNDPTDDGKRFVSIRDIIDDNRMFEIYEDLTDPRKVTFKEVHKQFKNYKFSVVYVLDQEIGTVCSIFERINNSGKTLNVVDLMVAKTWSGDFNLRNKLFEFQKTLRGINYSNINDIILLQCFSTNIQKRCHRKDILNLTKEQLEESWDKSTEAIKKSVDFFRSNLNIFNSKILPFGSLLVPLTYFFYQLDNVVETDSQRKIIIDWFWKACISNRFDSGVESKIAEDVKKFDEILNHKDVKFNYVIPMLTEDKIIDQTYDLGSAFCNTIMCIYAYQKPVHLENNAPVDFASFSKFNAIEFHHLFPQAYLRDEQPDHYSEKDSIVNIAFVRSGTNKKFSNNAPQVYLQTLNNTRLDEALKTHLITDIKESGLFENDFEKFKRYRAGVILKEIQNLGGEFSQVEKGVRENKEKQIELFEKDIRKIIDVKLLLVDQHYWNNKITDELKKIIEERITEWLSKHPYEKRENKNPLEFCNIMDYFRIIKQNWDVFQPIFKSRTELEKHFLHINDFRNAVKHSRDVGAVTRKLAEASLEWFDHIFENEFKLVF